jgi:hypothetical protein
MAPSLLRGQQNSCATLLQHRGKVNAEAHLFNLLIIRYFIVMAAVGENHGSNQPTFNDSIAGLKKGKEEVRACPLLLKKILKTS